MNYYDMERFVKSLQGLHAYIAAGKHKMCLINIAENSTKMCLRSCANFLQPFGTMIINSNQISSILMKSNSSFQCEQINVAWNSLMAFIAKRKNATKDTPYNVHLSNNIPWDHFLLSFTIKKVGLIR